MPVVPSSSYYSSSRSYFPRSTPSSSSLLLGRTTSLDRSSYSSYTPTGYSNSYGSSSYGSSYASSYSAASKPPRPSYTSSSSSYYSDTYKSRREGASPARSSAYTSRNSSDSRDSETRSYEKTIGQRSVSDASSRYAASTVSSRLRDNSSSRDSGYGSRLTSRDRSLDIKNGNVIDSKAYGPSPSSYASNYRWEGRSKSSKDKSAEKQSEDESEAEKVKVSDRIRNFESFDDDSPTSSASARSYINDEVAARRKRDEDNITARRQRLGLSPIRKSRSKTPDVPTRRKYATPERNGNADDNDDEEAEKQKSVSELRRKYDTSNHNGYISSSNDDEDAKRDTPTIRCDSPDTGYTSARRRTDSGSRDSPPSVSKYGDYSSSRYNTDRDRTSYLESPSLNRRRRDGSPLSRSPDGRTSSSSGSSSLTNGYKHLDDPSCYATSGSGYGSTSSSGYGSTSSSGYGSTTSSAYGRSTLPRRDRVRERIAARLAREVEDEDSPSSSRNSGGSFSETSGLVGLRNIGNTCFMNSVTQCLSNTRCLLEYMVKEGYSGDINTSSLSTMKGDLIRAFGNLISEMWTEGDVNRALNTGPFKSQIQKFAPAFTGYQQHDAQEFLRKLLEGLHEDVNRVTVRPRAILDDIDDDLSDDRKAMESWKRYLRFDDSKIVDMFVGQLKSSLKCSVCSHTSVTFDPFWDLSLPIPTKSGSVKLNQCLDLFTKEEIMDGDERPTCSKCKERRKMTKSFSIQKFPRILVLHLKRFSPTERWRGKLSCTVEFPLETLDLSKYASSTLSSCTYNLNGVANHSGTTYSGHYTAFCKHPYSAQWHEYNDSRVSSIAARRVCSSEAYVLFYELALPAASRL